MGIVGNSSLTGPIPADLGKLTNLTYLNLEVNSLSGTIPVELANLKSLNRLNLLSNQLMGGIPVELGTLADLEDLWLQHNELTGPIPSALGDLANLQRLNLGGNRLTGPIPAELGRLANLRELNLRDNRLTGPIPAALTNLNELMLFDVSRTDVCVPSDPPFRRWKAGIEDRGGWFSGAWCHDHAGDRATLEAFYDATGGSEWRTSTNWKTGVPLRDWYGVTTDADGRVIELALYHNGLTGSIPLELGSLSSLRSLGLGQNELSGFIPPELGRLRNLQLLLLPDNGLIGQTPMELTNLDNLNSFDVSGNAVCVPSLAEFEAWRGKVEARGGTFLAFSCDDHAGDREDGSRIDVLAVYTSAAEETAGGSNAIQAVIDLAVAETNQAFRDSGVITRVNLVGVEEVEYRFLEQHHDPVFFLRDPSDGHMDEVHAMRDERAADLVALFVTDPFPYGGTAFVLRAPHLANAAEKYAFSVTHIKHPSALAHELGHNMGLDHDRWDEVHRCCTARDGRTLGEGLYPYGYGYVNQRAFDPDAPGQSRWYTVMAIGSQCGNAGFGCRRLLRYSNPDLTHDGDQMGVRGDERTSSLTGPADARRTLNEASHIVANYRRDPADRVGNRPPTATGILSDRELPLHDTLTVDVSQAFVDPRW